MDTRNIQVVKDLLATPQKIVIVAHQNPDGDAIGSSLGLFYFLKSMPEHQVSVVMPNDFPEFLKWLPGVDEVQIFEKDMEGVSAIISRASVIFTLDFNTFSRVGKMEMALREATAKFVMIDHHQLPDTYATATFSDVTMSSTSEYVFHVIKSLQPEYLISKEIGTCLYTGIMTDTGSFRYATTSPTTHRVAATLLEAGVSNAAIHEHVFDANTPQRMNLLGVALKNLVVLPEYRTAYITLTQQELDENHFRKGDTEGFVNYALSVRGVILAAIFIENKQEQIVKISFRSKGIFSVNDFARNYFNGGGHINAAGGRSNKSLEETIIEFKTILKEHKASLNAD
ncbi:MAG TPA: bifunctional oligoribonuclease/PAP phosphatase NrnA [Flavobacteriaceae bacterium]|nr:bifunctional oligoribonuclease/PAP phosphatase NrnA [Flavobacteriaceae bacterium]